MSLCQILTYTIGCTLGQGFPKYTRSGSKESNPKLRIVTLSFSLGALVLCLSYSGLIVAVLLDKTTPKQINTLEDLVQNDPDVKIIVKDKTFMQKYLVNSEEFQVRTSTGTVRSQKIVLLLLLLSMFI